MTESHDRLRVLKLIESGQVSAEEGGRLLDSMSEGREATRSRLGQRILRVRVTDLGNGRQKVNITVPTTLIGVGARLGARLLPRGSSATIEDLQRLIESGAAGRIYDMQDLEAGERVEIFVE